MAYDVTVGAGLARAPLTGAHKWYVLMEGASQIPGGFEEAFAGTLETALERAPSRRHDRRLARTATPILEAAQIHPGGADPRGGSIKRDVSVAVGDVPALIAEATPAVEAFEPSFRVVAFRHLGDRNIHFNVSSRSARTKRSSSPDGTR